jgi:hypothetical protein
MTCLTIRDALAAIGYAGNANQQMAVAAH